MTKTMKTIQIPELALVLLVGASGSGKSTFARRHFKPTEIISSDACRALVSDDESDMTATADAFDILHAIAAKRLTAGRLTVIDATNTQQQARAQLLALAREHDVFAVAIVLDVPERVCLERNRTRSDRTVPEHAIRNQKSQLRRSLRGLAREGFRSTFVLDQDAIADSAIERTRLWSNCKDECGPFDIIGDVHGCCDELELLLERLGYEPFELDAGDYAILHRRARRHPEGRRAVFVGDLVDRGPRVLDTLQLVRNMVAAGSALCVPGNHDVKLMKKMRGRNVQLRHGLEQSVAELDALPAGLREPFEQEMSAFIDGLVSHLQFDGGRLVVAHAGMKARYQGKTSGRVREFALFGETTGETDEFGLPVRFDWAREYRGSAMVVYGHVPVPEAEWLNNTIDIDTGCVFGGRLTALRYPERELVSVPAARVYADPVRPLRTDAAPGLTAQQAADETLSVEDLLGKLMVETRLAGRVTIREENASAALEVMSRYAVDPRWLIYLPPTMSPTETTDVPGYLEHPREAFNYFASRGIAEVICEEKHMGSRAVVVLARDAAAARRRFGTTDERAGICYTRTGRPFFADDDLERALLDRLREALDRSGFWEEFATDWVCLDCELMPWSAKAQALLRAQYAAVGAAGHAVLAAAVAALEPAARQVPEAADLSDRMRRRAVLLDGFVDAYRGYCWEVASLDDYRIAPFHILATEGSVHADKTNLWHMETIARVLCRTGAPLLQETNCVVVRSDEPESVEAGIRWWEELTAAGGEGMVVKPMSFVPSSAEAVQPAIKCRGREYLRIIYGPEYSLPENLERLRSRSVGAKRGLAGREFALGIEGLERFVARQPLRRVHECVFGVLALESEPVDPRL